MNSKNEDQEYLSRELIDDVEYVINENEVCISSPHTLYVKAMLRPCLKMCDMLTSYKSIRKKAKALGVRIHNGMRIKKTIMERWSEYEESYKNACKLYKQLITQAELIRERGIHMGTSDDMELKKIYVFFESYAIKVNSEIADMEKINHRLTEVDNKLDNIGNEGSECQIYL